MVCSGPCVPLAECDGGRVILMLSRAVSIVHSTNLLHFGLLQAFCVCSLARQGLLHWDGVSRSPGMGKGAIVSHLCHVENGNQKLTPMQKIVAVGSTSCCNP